MAMSSGGASALHTFMHNLPGSSTDETLMNRFRDVSMHQRYGHSGEGAEHTDSVVQVAMGPRHLAVLTHDGRVLRNSMAVNAAANKAESSTAKNKDRLYSHMNIKKEPRSSTSAVDDTAAAKRPTTEEEALRAARAAAMSADDTVRSQMSKIRRVMLATRGSLASIRGGRSVIVAGGGGSASRPMVAASAVPENLITQAQAVLLGKSRQVIIRELQRTNLNVNQAVDNLLAQDDDDEDDEEFVGGDGVHELVLPEAELLQLIDSGLLRCVDGTTFMARGGTAADGEDAMAAFETNVMEALSRRRRQPNATVTTEGRHRNEAGSQSFITKESPLSINDDRLLEWTAYNADGTRVVFTDIAATYSTLWALDANGRLWDWQWHTCDIPIKPSTPAEAYNVTLNVGERITRVSSSLMRVTLVTSALRVAAFMDVAVGVCVQKFINTGWMPLAVDRKHMVVAHMATSNHFSVVLLRNAEQAPYLPNYKTFWWGVIPFNERKSAWEKTKSAAMPTSKPTDAVLSVGDEVSMRSGPLYGNDAIAFTLFDGVPKVGMLIEDVSSFGGHARFQLLSAKQLDSDQPWLDAIAAVDAAGEKRRHEASPTGRVETWPMKECTFVYAGKQNQLAKLVTIDNDKCGVLFKGVDGEYANDPDTMFKTMRLFKKDELQVVSSTAPRCPRYLQSTPMSVELASPTYMSMAVAAHDMSCTPLDVVADSLGIRMLADRVLPTLHANPLNHTIHLTRFSIGGKLLSDHVLPISAAALYGLAVCPPSLLNYGDESILLMVDGNSCMVPINRSASGGYRLGTGLLLQPVNAIAIGVHGSRHAAVTSKCNRHALVAMITARQPLMDAILSVDIVKVEEVLNTTVNTVDMLTERIDGNRGLLHAAVMMCRADTNANDSDAASLPPSDVIIDGPPTEWRARIAHLMVDDAATYESAQHSKWAQMTSKSFGVHEPPVTDAVAAEDTANIDSDCQVIVKAEQMDTPAVDNRVAILRARVCTDAKARQTVAMEVLTLLCARLSDDDVNVLSSIIDVNGQTPFMLALAVRCYTAAHHLWRMHVGRQECTDYIYPHIALDASRMHADSSVHGDDRLTASPLLLICRADTCTFTFTGNTHIRQAIYDCRTCGLVGSLCCCTECALTCHAGHDCQIKTTSPSAFCDCWERCPCKSLIGGNVGRRFELLMEMISTERVPLIDALDEDGVHIMLFLVRTLARQLIEHREYKTNKSRARLHAFDPEPPSAPEHNLPPPSFARRALLAMLNSWTCVASLLNVGVNAAVNGAQLVDMSTYLTEGQQEANHLDQFMYALVMMIAKNDVQSPLLMQLTQTVHASTEDEQAMARRYVRSLLRVYCTLHATMSCNQAASRPAAPASRSGLMSSSRYATTTSVSPTAALLAIQQSVQVMYKYAIVEIVAAANACIAPVRFGFARPTQSYELMSGGVDVHWATVGTMMLSSKTSVTRGDLQRYMRYRQRQAHTASHLKHHKEKHIKTEPSAAATTTTASTPSAASTVAGQQRDANDPVGTYSWLSRRRMLDDQHYLQSIETASASPLTLTTLAARNAAAGNAAPAEAPNTAQPPPTRRTTREQEMEEEEDDRSDVTVDLDTAAVDEATNDTPSNGGNGAATNAEGEQFSDDDDEDERDEDDYNEEEHEHEEEVYDDMDEEHEEEYYDDEEDYNEEDTTAAHEVTTTTTAASASDTNNAVSTATADDNTIDSSSDDGEHVEQAPPVVAQPSIEIIVDQPVVEEVITTTDKRLFGASAVDKSLSSTESFYGQPAVMLQTFMAWRLRPDTASSPLLKAPTPCDDHEQHVRRSVVTPYEESHKVMSTSAQLAARKPGIASSTATGNGALLTAIQSAGTAAHNVVDGANSNEKLCRVFAVLVELIIQSLPNGNKSTDDAKTAMTKADDRLSGVWQWMYQLLDTIESQLRYGIATRQRQQRERADLDGAYGVTMGDELVRTLPLTRPTDDGVDAAANNNAQSFTTYMLSLLRAQSDEHGDTLLTIDPSQIRHLAYVCHAFFQYIKHSDEPNTMPTAVTSTADVSAPAALPTIESIGNVDVAPFYRRSNSTMFVGIDTSEGTFESALADTLPLAVNPLLLRSTAHAESLFAAGNTTKTREKHHVRCARVFTMVLQQCETNDGHARGGTYIGMCDLEETKEESPSRVGGQRQTSTSRRMTRSAARTQHMLTSLMAVQANNVQTFMSRWRYTLHMMADLYASDDLIANQPTSVFQQTVTLAYHADRFRAAMSAARNNAHNNRDVSFINMERGRMQIMQRAFAELNVQVGTARTCVTSPINRVKVTFKGEPGEGSGVARSFYAALVEALLSAEPLYLQTYNPAAAATSTQSTMTSGMSRSGTAIARRAQRAQMYATSAHAAADRATRRLSVDSLVAMSAGVPRSTAAPRADASMQAELPMADDGDISLIPRPIDRDAVDAMTRASLRASFASADESMRRLEQRAQATNRATIAVNPATTTVAATNTLNAILDDMSAPARYTIQPTADAPPSTAPPPAAAQAPPPPPAVEEAMPRCTFNMRALPLDLEEISATLPADDLRALMAYVSEQPSHQYNIQNLQIVQSVLWPFLRAGHQEHKELWPRIMGIVMSLSVDTVVRMVGNADIQAYIIEQAVDAIHRAKPHAEHSPTNVTREQTIAMTNSLMATSTPLTLLTSTDASTTLCSASCPSMPPLFYHVENTSSYAPLVVAECNETRVNAYRNVGRLIGLCMQQNELLPLPLCRHVYKYILGREVNWFDLAFFDPQLYESLRQLALNYTTVDELQLTFAVTLGENEGGPRQVELVANGANIAVTADNLLHYVKLYVQCRLVDIAQQPLHALRTGVHDVLSSTSHASLTAEHMRLLLCGEHTVDVMQLKHYTIEGDESGASKPTIQSFMRWFWRLIGKLNEHQKQELIYFWTGSTHLPYTLEALQPAPSIMIRPPDEHHLPTANTCISRLYLPLYSNKHTLKLKLMQAIKTSSFGFV